MLFFIYCFWLQLCSKNGAILYKAQSQDEDALVNAAAQLHMVFVNKNADILGTTLHNGDT